MTHNITIVTVHFGNNQSPLCYIIKDWSSAMRLFSKLTYFCEARVFITYATEV